MAGEVSRAQVVAFRLRAHRLSERAAADALLDVAGRCGIQDSPPGSAVLALHARVRDVTSEGLASALGERRTLLRTWSLRGAPYVVPTADAAVWTTGVLPPTEQATRHFLLGLGQAADQLRLSATELVELTAVHVGPVLGGRRLAIDELGAELARRILPELSGDARMYWEREGPYSPGQPLGEAVVHFCLRILALRGVVCFAERVGNKAPFVLVDEWLGHPIPAREPAAARAELVRRYLHRYGPSTRRQFAAWVGVSAGDAAAWWNLVADELIPVEFDGRSWLLAEDLDALRSARTPTGVRLLPPHDPYTQLRDRATILDRELHRAVWRAVGDPGTVLADGEIVGTWRPRKSGRKLTLSVVSFRPLSDRVADAVRAEAESVAVLRGATSVEVEFDPT